MRANALWINSMENNNLIFRQKLATLCFIISFCLFMTAEVAYSQDLRKREKSNPLDKEEVVLAAIEQQRVITQKEVDALASAEIYDLQVKIYNLRKNALEQLILKAALEREALSRGITVAELKSQLLPRSAFVSPIDVDREYAENKKGFGNISEEEAKERIRLDLEKFQRIAKFREALELLRNEAKVEIFLEMPPLPIVAVNDNGPSLGPLDAPVTIVEFSDFECPYCRNASKVIKEVVKAYDGKVRLVYKHLPLNIHPRAAAAAAAAVCADEQGKFWNYHDILFNATDLSEKALKEYASGLNLDMKKIESCLRSPSTKSAIFRDMQEASRIGVEGTPTYIINGKMLRGEVSVESLKQAIDQELKDDSKK